MYILLETEIKLNLEGSIVYDAKVQYVDECVRGVYDNADEALAAKQALKEEILGRGYFDKVEFEYGNACRLCNGGSCYKQIAVREMEVR